MSRGAVALATLLLSGCASPPPIAQLAFATTRSGVVAPERLRDDVEGRSCFTRDAVRVLLTPPWRAPRANHALAIADALASVPEANVLTDVRVRVRVQQFLLFERVCAIVHGDAGRVR